MNDDGFCVLDGCPAEVCGGPHEEHEHGDYLVQLRRGQTCAWCSGHPGVRLPPDSVGALR